MNDLYLAPTFDVMIWGYVYPNITAPTLKDAKYIATALWNANPPDGVEVEENDIHIVARKANTFDEWK